MRLNLDANEIIQNLFKNVHIDTHAYTYACVY